MGKIDLDKYNDGRRAFTEGSSLLSLMEKLLAADNSGIEAEFNGAASFGVGFFDAAFDKLRGIAR